MYGACAAYLPWMEGKLSQPVHAWHLAAGAFVVALVLGFVGLLSAPGSSRAAGPLETGFADPLFSSSDAATQTRWLGEAKDANAGIARLLVNWRGIVSGKPSNAANPADPAYNFAALDRDVRAADAQGLDVLITFFGAPDWAEGRTDRSQRHREPGSRARRPSAHSPRRWHAGTRALSEASLGSATSRSSTRSTSTSTWPRSGGTRSPMRRRITARCSPPHTRESIPWIPATG